MKRYRIDRTLSSEKLATAEATVRIRRALELNLLPYREVIIRESQRLDHLAYLHLGNADHWWVLAAMSGIGWGMQVPPGTVIKVPENLSTIQAML